MRLMRDLVCFLALSLAVARPPIAVEGRPIQAQAGGVLDGQVVNGTAGAAAVGAGLPVTLYVLQGEAELASRQATTDDQGRFRFDGLDPDPDLSYLLETVYLGVTYSAPEPYRFGTAAEQQGRLAAQLAVYETTDDPGHVRLDTLHIIAESFGSVLRLTEVQLFGNSGDRTFVGMMVADRPTTTYIPLPQGAVGLSFEDEASQERYVQVEGGLFDTAPVPPGTATSVARFSYHLMVSGSTISIEHPFAYPVGIVNILAVQPGLTVRGSQIQDQGLQSMGGSQFEVYIAQGLGPGQPLALEIDLTPGESGSIPAPAAGSAAGTAGPRGNQGLLRAFGVGLTLVAAIGAVLYPLLTRRLATRHLPTYGRHSATVSPPSGLSSPLSSPAAQPILSELASLEQAYEAGEVDEATYERQRAAAIQALKRLSS